MQSIRRIIPTFQRQSGQLCRAYCDAPVTSGRTGERGLNRAELIGRVGRDPEVRGSNERPVTIFSLATSQFIRTAEGETRQMTDWHRIAVFRPGLAQYVQNVIKKGDKLYVSGSINYGEYRQDGGEVVKVTSIRADEILRLKPALGPDYRENDPSPPSPPSEM